MNIHFIKSSGKKIILAQLENQFGISELPYLLIESSKEKIRGFSGHLSKEEIYKLAKIANIETIGIYLLKKEHDIRLSFDATNLLGKQIKKHIIAITEEQLVHWLRGDDIIIEAEQGTIVLKCKSDFIGCGKSTGRAIINHVPKERRIRK